jgi:hypothetical protein
MAAHFLVFCEPVKKHGLGVACGLESGDVVGLMGDNQK